MKDKRTWVLLAIATILGVLIVLLERTVLSTGNPTKLPSPTPLPALFAFPSQEVRMIRISGPEPGDNVELVYRNNSWYLTTPVEGEADLRRVDSFLRAAVGLRPQALIEEQSDELADYRLDPAQIELEIVLADGSQQSLHLGEQATSQTGYYARVPGAQGLYVVSLGFGMDVRYLLEMPPLKPTPRSKGPAVETVPPPPTPTASP